jgi:SAM-dependent methyltransferase
MNKTAIRNFATEARRNLIEQVGLRAKELGVTETACSTAETGPDYVVLGGLRYPKAYERAYERLCAEWKSKGFHRLVEEVAYTWFNRIIAIRYMEIHDYLPSHVRILSSAQPGGRDPEVLTRYRELTFPVDIPFVEQALRSGDREGAYRHLLLGQCEELHRIMPFLFEPVADYTELLLPGRLLHADSVIQKLVREVPEEDFADVEIIGWMYQYYVSERKKEVFDAIKKGCKVAPEDIPAATQLFTPAWIVQYMVQNSVGRLWMDSGLSVDKQVPEHWRYYIHPIPQREDVQRQWEETKLKVSTPEEIRVLDPACGSGHILVYAYELLYERYEQAGYDPQDIPYLILENNLYGLEIDDRAAQLAGFALMMKARATNRRVFQRPPRIHVYSIPSVEGMDVEFLVRIVADGHEGRARTLRLLVDEFTDAKNRGSLIKPVKLDVSWVRERLSELRAGTMDLFHHLHENEIDWLERLLDVYELLTRTYHVVVTNPPYMGTRNMHDTLKDFLKESYPDTKSDLFAAFMERSLDWTEPSGLCAMVNQQSWMFIKSYEKWRARVLEQNTILCMAHLGAHAFDDLGGEVVQTTSFVIAKRRIPGWSGIYFRLVDLDNSDAKAAALLNRRHMYRADQQQFFDIPGAPIAYWATDRVREIFRDNPKLGEMAEPRQGLATADNNRFLRLWHEVDIHRIGFGMQSREEAIASEKKWFPYNKGGDFRKWYGNQDYVVNWNNDGEEIKRHVIERYPYLNGNYEYVVKNETYYFREGITWTFVGSSNFSVRYTPQGFIFDVAGSTVFPDASHIAYLTGFLCSSLCPQLLEYMNPTLNFQVGNIASLPIVIDEARKPEIDRLVQECIQVSKDDWDDFETSWNFQVHPLVRAADAGSLEKAFAEWQALTESRFRKLKENETAINEMFAEIYGLEARPVQDEDITIRRADRERDAKSFLSYFIGCLMGRYSLDYPGLAFAGGEWDPSRYKRFVPDPDGIVPLTDEPYFEDDVMRRLEEFLTVLFGAETVADNLAWLAESIGSLRANETPAQRIRRYLADEFYKDHLKTYRKRPIYWLFESGGKKGFRALMYLHRYNRETLPRVRLQYVQALQRQYAQEVDVLTRRIESGMLSAAERSAAKKRIRELEDRQLELAAYDQKLAALANDRIDLDLDDGVVANHAKLATVLAPIK